MGVPQQPSSVVSAPPGTGGVGMVPPGLADMADAPCWLLDCVGSRVDGLLMGIWFELICLEG